MSEKENLDNEVRKTIQSIDANEPEIGLWMDSTEKDDRFECDFLIIVLSKWWNDNPPEQILIGFGMIAHNWVDS